MGEWTVNDHVSTRKGRRAVPFWWAALILSMIIGLAGMANASQVASTAAPLDKQYVASVKKELVGNTWEAFSSGGPYGIAQDFENGSQCLTGIRFVDYKYVELFCNNTLRDKSPWDVVNNNYNNLDFIVFANNGQEKLRYQLRFNKNGEIFMLIKIENGKLMEQSYILFRHKRNNGEN